jgi:hypothetical protein
LAEDGKCLDGFVVVGDEIHHPVPALPQLLRVHRPHRPAAVATIAGTTPVPDLATTKKHQHQSLAQGITKKSICGQEDEMFT